MKQNTTIAAIWLKTIDESQHQQNAPERLVFELGAGLFKKMRQSKSGDLHIIFLQDGGASQLSTQLKKILERFQISFELWNFSSQGRDIRGFQFKELMLSAYQRQAEYLICFADGAADCLQEFSKKYQDGLQGASAISCFYRSPSALNPGRLFNYLANIFASLSCGLNIKDVKADGITLYRVGKFVDSYDDMLFDLSDDQFYFWDLLQKAAYHRLSIEFNGPNLLATPNSDIKLNTSFFIGSLRKFLTYFFLKKTTLKRNKSKLNPRTVHIEKLAFSQEEPAQAPKKEIAKVAEKDRKLEKKKKLAPVDPGKKLIKLEHENPDHSNIMVVNWCLTNICNYKCTYCPDSLHNGTRKGPSLDLVKNFFQKVKVAQPDKKVFFEFTGGEVTYYKQFPELIRYIKESGGYVGILSNGARKIDFWEKHHEFIDHICLSFHSEQGDPEHFFNVASYICQRITTHVNIMMKPENFDTCYELARRLARECQLSIAMQPLLENMDGALFDYTDYQKKILDEQILFWSPDPQFKMLPEHKPFIARGAMKGRYQDGNEKVFSTPELISKDLNQWAGWECSIGVENLVVDLEGNIIRGWCNVGGNIGNVTDADFQLPQKPITCNKKYCNCGQDIMASKVKAVARA